MLLALQSLAGAMGAGVHVSALRTGGQTVEVGPRHLAGVVCARLFGQPERVKSRPYERFSSLEESRGELRGPELSLAATLRAAA